MPIRRELLPFGLSALVADARKEQRRWLWTDMNRLDGNVTKISGYFSSFWATLSRDELKTGAGLSLYSFRHTFQDALAKAGHGEEVKKALMGHAEGGMTSRYGTKRRPREVNIQEIDAAIQELRWPFLKQLHPDGVS